MNIFNNKVGIYLFMAMFLSLSFISSPVYSQSAKTVTGIVKGSDGEPLIGANIIIDGTTTGTVTGVTGQYSISARANQSLQFSYLGYATQTIAVGFQSAIDVVLAEDGANTLDDVVVVGYGTMRKADLTGSVGSVSGDVFEKSTGASFTEALAGKVSGVQVTQMSGVPGGGSTIRIRGSNSIGNAEPLYIIDGVAMDDANSSVGGFDTDGSSISPLSMINPSEIESMEILKDASATAIYGSRASNGVVIITTKSGSAGKGRVNIDFNYGMSNIAHKMELLDASQYTIINNEANYWNNYTLELRDNPQSVTGQYAIAEKGFMRNTDWQDLLFQTGHNYTGNIMFSGGTQAIKYMLSLGTYKAEGTVPKTDFERYSGRLNVDFEVNKYFKVGARVSISNIITNGLPTSTTEGTSTGTGSIISRALQTAPTTYPYSDDVYEYDPDSDENSATTTYTPFMVINAITQRNVTASTQTALYGEYKILPALTLRVSGNYSSREGTTRYYQDTSMPYGYTIGGWARTYEALSISKSNENTLTWNKKFNNNHRLNLVAGFSISESSSESQTVSVQGFATDEFLWYNLYSGTNVAQPTNSYSDNRLVSWFGRANYTLKDRYLFTATMRIDGSSKFAAGNKYGYFPAGAFAWRISEEPWMKNQSTINNLKLRFSYGITGNQSVSAYSSLSLLTPSIGVFGSSYAGSDTKVVGFTTSSTMPYADLRWETTTQYNAGFDISLFDSRIEIVGDAYYKLTDDLLISSDVPYYTGYTSAKLNFGQMSNFGVEFNITGRIIETKDMSLTTSFNISHNETYMTNLQDDYYLSGYGLPWNSQNTQILIEGEKLGTFWGLVRDGIVQADEDTSALPTVLNTAVEVGQQKYLDLSGDGNIGEEDKTIIGCAQADFTFGWNTSFSYKNLDISLFIDGSYGNDIFNVNALTGLRFNAGQQFSTVWTSRYTADNPSNVYPRIDHANLTPSIVLSRRYIEDGSFIRFQTLSIGYTLPSRWLRKLKMSKVRFYASVGNLWTITNYSGYSPDVSYGGSNNLMMGHDSGAYPSSTSYQFGVNLGF